MTTNTIHTNDRRRRVERVLGFTAGIAVTLAAGYMFAVSITDAAGNGDDTTFIPITPCRLFDTRPAPDTVGPRSTPLGADDTLVQQVTGANGACTIPAGATAVALNATAVGATAPSFGTFYPADATRPVASNLNYVPGQPPTPNKVDVKLSADGAGLTIVQRRREHQLAVRQRARHHPRDGAQPDDDRARAWSTLYQLLADTMREGALG